MAVRNELIETAVTFLRDPKVKNSSLAKKIAFLESKGLTSEEIDKAVQLSGTSTPTNSTSKLISTQAGSSIKKKQTWKDFVFILLGISGASYFLYLLYKEYIYPNFLKNLFHGKKKQKEQALMDTLKSLQAQNSEQIQLLIQQNQSVQQHLTDLKEILLKNSESKDWLNHEMAGFKNDLENLKLSVPQLVEKSNISQLGLLNDLQADLRSLKVMILNRRIGTNTTPTGALSLLPPSPPNVQASSSAISEPDISSSTASAFNIAAQSSIPAWQRALRKDSAGHANQITPENEPPQDIESHPPQPQVSLNQED